MRAALVLLAGCAVAGPIGPAVEVVPSGDPWTQADLDWMEAGAHVWGDLGFTYGPSDLPPCARDWMFTGVVDCRITVTVRRVPGSYLPVGVAAWTDRSSDTIEIADGSHGSYLMHLTAHELGHVLLDTPLHLGPDVPGIMQAASDLTVPTEADWALACVATGICI